MGDTPLICGGYFNGPQKSCYSLKEDGSWKWETSSDLNVARQFAANGNVIVNNKLMIAGGTNGSRLTTFEVVAPNTKSLTLPISLPAGIFGSCIVPWDTDTYMIIAGCKDSSPCHSRLTYFINLANNTITNGPSLLTGRYIIGCHAFNLNGEDYIVVSGGGTASPFSSTEVISKKNVGKGWQKSKTSQKFLEIT